MRKSFFLLLLVAALTLGAVPGAAAEAGESGPVDWLRQYLRIDSSTVDGARRAGALLKSILHSEGVSTKWIVSPQGQPFLYARAGSSDPAADTLMLLHHIDVVPAGNGWSHPPFGAEVFEDTMYGRGAVDDKSLGLAHLIAFLRFRQATNPDTALVFLAVGGEEAGGAEGIAWLLEHHSELFEDIGAVLTEGGTNRLYGQTLAWWGVEVAQKRPLWLLARASGRPGHGSSLNLHSAPHRLIRGLGRLIERPLEFRVTPEARQFLQALMPLESPAFRSVVGNLDAIVESPEPATQLLPGLPNYLLDTFQVNVLAAGTDINVTPELAEARIDIRLLPDTDQAALLADLQQRAGKEVELEVLLSSPPVAPTPTDHPVYASLERVLGAEAPVVPAFITAITDARYLRQRGIAVYGFSPFRLQPSVLRGIHASDEHMPLKEYRRGIETMWKVVSACAGL